MFASAFALMLVLSPPEAATESAVDAGAPADPQPGDEGAVGEGEGAPTPVEPPAPEEPPLAPGSLVLAPTIAGAYQVYDHEGDRVGEAHELTAGEQLELSLQPGVYSIHGPEGVVPVAVVSDERFVWDGTQLLTVERWARERGAEDAVDSAPAPVSPPPEAPVSPPNWRAWASPLSSALIPGVGQFLNGQGGKGTGLLFATVGSIAAATALFGLRNDGTRGQLAEYTRLIGYGTFSTAAPMLWVVAIADAYRVATKSEIEPNLDHKLRLSVNRMMTVGFRADAQRPGFYDDWSVSIMGQAARRFSLGASDLSVKLGGVDGPQVWQFGLRFDYRVFDRRRLWIDLALGSIVQVAVGQGDRALDPGAAGPGRVTKFAAVPYGQLDLRLFVLSRLSLDLVPRLAVPVTTRYYSANRALPRYAPILELGAGLSTYF